MLDTPYLLVVGVVNSSDIGRHRCFFYTDRSDGHLSSEMLRSEDGQKVGEA